MTPGPTNPDIASVIVKCTSTAVLFQPFAFAGVRVAEMDGSVLSILSVTDCEVDNPTPFVAVHVRVSDAVSVLVVVVEHPVEEAMPDSGSVVVQFTVTSLRYQP